MARNGHRIVNIPSFLANGGGGLIGLEVTGSLTILVYFHAFMVAFGTDTPTARAILAVAGIFIPYANPLWIIPIAYLVGAWLLPSVREQEPS